MDKARHKEAVESPFFCEEARDDTNPALRCGGHENGQSSRSVDAEFFMRTEEAGDDLLALLRLERTDRIDERPAWLHPLHSAVEQLRLELGIRGNDMGTRAVQHFGMAAECARGRARSVKQHRVEFAIRRPG